MFLTKFTEDKVAIKYSSKFSKDIYSLDDFTSTKKILNFVGGEIVIFNSEFVKDLQFSTILGSCVSIVFNDNVNKIVGVSHFLKPVAKTSFEDNFSSGDLSSDFILAQMVKLGADINNIKAQIFGGASVNEALRALNPGRKNILFAEEYLQKKSIRFSLVSTEGIMGRIILVGRLGFTNFEFIKND